MFKRFSDVIYELNKEPIEKQLVELKQMIINLAEFLEKLINSFHNDLSIIHYKIISLEAKNTLFKLSKPNVPPPPPLPSMQHEPIDRETVRSIMLREIKELFTKKEG